ncbi:MAG: PepSY-like domain-containing protein [Muribaculaceae bacterium]|nr:PepSY-like domain-containing protein [Muribaculaceae bacterium]
MKKFLKFIPALLIAIAAVGFTGCSDDKDEPVNPSELPTTAKTFLDTYYPTVKIVTTTKDKDDYEVTLANGHKVDFTKSGEWTDVDAPQGQTIPSGFYPAQIDAYIETAYPGYGINEISRISQGYDVELTNAVDLIFSHDGSFISIDPD